MNKSLFQITFYLSICVLIFNCSTRSTQENEPVTEIPPLTLDNQPTADKDVDPFEKSSTKTAVESKMNDIETKTADQSDDIILLKAKLKYLERELQKKGETTSVFENPYTVFNQQIIMDNGTIYYGNVIYQDDQLVTIETLIGKLNLERDRIVRVLSHKVNEDDVPAFEDGILEENINTIEDGNVIYNSPANIILLGNIVATSDEHGNTVLSGQVKNSGGKRADFVKINMTLYRDWSQTLPPKTFSVFVEGSRQYFDVNDSSKVSTASVEPKAIANFALIVPNNFGSVMSWTYNVDFEEY